jgi:hypothetical protein
MQIGTVFTMPVVVFGIKKGDFSFPIDKLVLPLTVLHPPLPPPEVSNYRDYSHSSNKYYPDLPQILGA